MSRVLSATAAMFLIGTSTAYAGVWTAGSASGAAGTSVTIPFEFAGDGQTISAQAVLSVASPLVITAAVGQNGQSCSVSIGQANTVLFSFSPLSNTSTNYCNVTINIPGGTSAGSYATTITGQLCAISGGGAAPSCTVVNGAVTVTGGGGGNTPPVIAYAPTTGTTINYTGAGTASPIVATPSGGAGSGAAATTTVGACTISGGGAAFPTTNIAQLSFVGATVTPQNINLPNCVPQAAATNATLTCPEVRGGTAVNPVPTWTLTCPAAAPVNTPPTITYTPAAGSNIPVASGGNTTIAVGCPTDGSACNGSGSGLAATSRLENLTVAYAGPPFSPLPSNLTCNFVTEAGGAAASPLDFAATAADAGDIRCACANVVVAEPYTVTVSERIPANSGAVTATRTFNVTCGNGLTCGSIAANPASGTVSLNNGGAAVTATTISVTGISPGINQTVTCAVSGASAGSTFAVTTVPSPLVLNSVTTSGTVSATCTNSNTTTATATLTCTSAGSAAGCPALSSTYTLSCPGQNAPPPVSTVPVPALSEQGRILLAALVLLLGVGVVGFRLRG